MLKQLILSFILVYQFQAFASEERLPADLAKPRSIPTDAYLLGDHTEGLDGSLGTGESYSLSPVVETETTNYYLSKILAPTSHIFDGETESGGINHFGTANGTIEIRELVLNRGGGVTRYVVEVVTRNSSGALEPWVDTIWTNLDPPLRMWRLDVGSTFGGSDPIQFTGPITVLNSGFIAYTKSATVIGEYALWADTSTSTSLSGVARLGVPNIAGYDFAGLQMYWDVTGDSADPATIIVDKVTVPSGSAQSFNFTLTGQDVNQPFALADGTTPYNSGDLLPTIKNGTYNVTETVPSGWTSDSSCSNGSPANAVNLSPGETVTCTFTNTLTDADLIFENSFE